MIQIIFGWPGIIAFVAIASAGAWMPSYKLMLAALILSLPNAFYLLAGNGWVQLIGLYIPISLLLSLVLIKRNRLVVPRVMLLPIYAFHGYLAYAVYTQ